MVLLNTGKKMWQPGEGERVPQNGGLGMLRVEILA